MADRGLKLAILPAVLTAGLAWPANARAAEPAPDQTSRWFVRVGALEAPYSPGARIAVGGQDIPGSSVSLHDSQTAIADIGYDVTDDVSVMLMVGVPPKPTITGAGAVSNLGALGRVRYGPVVLTGVYRLPRWGALRPYVGTGAAYAVILKSHDAAVRNLDVHDNWGFVLQAGAEYQLDERWAIFADVKKLWLSVDADGRLENGAPVKARVQLNPLLLSVGAKYHFR